MTTLIVATALSESLIQTICQENIKTDGDILVLSNSYGVKSVLAQIGVSCTVIDFKHEHNWEKHDRLFADLFLQGSKLDFCFPDTTLEAWRPLAMDRFSFWFGGQNQQRTIDLLANLKWDKAICSLDIHNILPWAVVEESKRRLVPVYFVQVSYIKTLEVYDLAMSGWFNGTTVIVGTDKEADWLKSLVVDAISLNDKRENKKATDLDRKQMRAGLDIPDGMDVEFIVFDLQDEYAFRHYLGTMVKPDQFVVICPVNELAAKKLPVLAGDLIRPYKIVDWNTQAVADRMVVFHWAEYAAKSKIPVKVVDEKKLNRAELLAE